MPSTKSLSVQTFGTCADFFLLSVLKNMQAFVGSYIPVPNSSSQRGETTKRRTRRRPVDEYGCHLQSVFLGQGLERNQVSIALGVSFSAATIRDGASIVCAKRNNEGNEQDRDNTNERGRRWWFFGKQSQPEFEGKDETKPFSNAAVDTRPQTSIEETSDYEKEKIATAEKVRLLEEEEKEREKGFFGFLVKAVESRKVSERRKKLDSEAVKEAEEDSLVFNVQEPKDELEKEQKVKAEVKYNTKNEDIWTQFLNVIVPNRKKENETNSKEIKDASVPPVQPLVVEKEPAEDSKGTNLLERLGGLRELYIPPSKSTEAKTVLKKTDESAKEEKVNLVAKFLSWFGQKSDKEDTKIKGEKKLKPSEQQTLMENANEVLENEKGKKTAVLVKPKVEPKVDEEKPQSPKITVAEKDEKSSNGVPQSEKKSKHTEKTSDKSKKLVPANAPVEVSSVPQKDVATIRLIFGSETFFATETVAHPGGLIFRGNLRGEPKATLAKLEKRLRDRLGDKYTLCLAEGDDDLRPVVVIVPTARDKRPSSSRQRIMALVIGLITLTTCFARGGYANLHSGVIRNAYGLPVNPSFIDELFLAAPISVMAISIALVVLVSQLVQRIVAARRKTRLALPYLIPSYQLGSFGAVVQLASPTPSRAALFDIAFSGALTLLVVSLLLLILGLQLSTSFPSVIPVSMSMVSSSLLIGGLTTFVPSGNILVDYGKSWIGLHPLAVIGANCLTIAALNLLPIRQLDGGRIVFAIYGRKTAVLASRVTIFFLLLASAKVPYYFVFLAAITFGPWSMDRPAKNELTEPDGVRAILGYLLLLVMVAILLPHPASKFFGTA